MLAGVIFSTKKFSSKIMRSPSKDRRRGTSGLVLRENRTSAAAAGCSPCKQFHEPDLNCEMPNKTKRRAPVVQHQNRISPDFKCIEPSVKIPTVIDEAVT